jgi:hypothetical protein
VENLRADEKVRWWDAKPNVMSHATGSHSVPSSYLAASTSQRLPSLLDPLG